MWMLTNKRVVGIMISALVLLISSVLFLAHRTASIGGDASRRGEAVVGEGPTVCGGGLRVSGEGRQVDVVHTRLQRADTEVECGPGLAGFISGRGKEVLALCLSEEGAEGGEPFVYVRTQPGHPAVDEEGGVAADILPTLPTETNGKTDNWYFGRAIPKELERFAPKAPSQADGRGEPPSGPEVTGCVRVRVEVEVMENSSVPHLVGVLDEAGSLLVEGEAALIP